MKSPYRLLFIPKRRYRKSSSRKMTMKILPSVSDFSIPPVRL